MARPGSDRMRIFLARRETPPLEQGRGGRCRRRRRRSPTIPRPCRRAACALLRCARPRPMAQPARAEHWSSKTRPGASRRPRSRHPVRALTAPRSRAPRSRCRASQWRGGGSRWIMQPPDIAGVGAKDRCRRRPICRVSSPRFAAEQAMAHRAHTGSIRRDQDLAVAGRAAAHVSQRFRDLFDRIDRADRRMYHAVHCVLRQLCVECASISCAVRRARNRPSMNPGQRNAAIDGVGGRHARVRRTSSCNCRRRRRRRPSAAIRAVAPPG